MFCFNRELCWTVAEQLKGKKVVLPEQQKQLSVRLDEYDWSQGAGPKLKQILIRGIGVHHAGVLPRYRRVVEELFQEKLLSVCVCTETLAAGINLPARSVVLPTLMKGPPKKLKLIEPSSAHQMFGRAGRPQYDDRGYVFALPHEDDVKLFKWKQKYDQIPEDTKDPGLIKAKKALKKKMPKRREGQQYWSESQFHQLVQSPPADLASRGPLTWRLLVYMLDASPDVDRIRKLVDGRLLKGKQLEAAQKALDRMLMVLWRGGYVELEPPPPRTDHSKSDRDEEAANKKLEQVAVETSSDSKPLQLDLGQRQSDRTKMVGVKHSSNAEKSQSAEQVVAPKYRAELAHSQESMADLLKLRGVHPLYALFLMNHLGIADRTEKIMAFESLLELSRSLGKAVRIPPIDELPAGATGDDQAGSSTADTGAGNGRRTGSPRGRGPG